MTSSNSTLTAEQSLTRVSISRKSREEMSQFFLSRAGEMIFHFSFSSRFSRSPEKILFLFSIYEILLSYSRSLLEFQDFEEKFLLLLSIVKIVLYLFLFLFQWKMVYFREKYALFRGLWTLCDSPETLTGWKSEIGTDQPTDSPDICHFLTPAPFPAEKFDTKKRVNRNTTDFATKQRKSIFHRPKKGYSFKRRRVEGRVVVGGYVGGRVVK